MECVKVLLGAGADINLPDPDGVSPLLLSIMNANWDISKHLILAGADVNQWDIFGEAPLFTVLGNRNQAGGGKGGAYDPLNQTTGTQIVHMLLERGANPNMQLFFRPANLNGVDQYPRLHAADPRGRRRGYGNDQAAAGNTKRTRRFRWPISRPRSLQR